MSVTAPQILAAVEFIKRKEWLSHPTGTTDNAGRWYPSGKEAEVFPFKGYRAPSRAWPWSFMHACRTAAQCARLYEVHEFEVRKVARAIRKYWNGTEAIEDAAARADDQIGFYFDNDK